MAELDVRTTPIRLRLFVTYKGYGWSENFWLRTTDLEEAQWWAFQVCLRRALWFGIGPYIEYALVTRGTAYRDTWAVPVAGHRAFPVDSYSAPREPHNAAAGLWYRFPGFYRGGGCRLLKGVPDDWIRAVGRVGYATQLQPLGYVPNIILQDFSTPGLPVTHIAPGQDLLEMQRSFLDALLAYTGLLRKTAGGSNTWTVEPLREVYYTSVGSMASSHPYRPVSWTGALSPPTGAGRIARPYFSPCGMVTGVSRVAYRRACRFFNDPGSPLGVIWHYYADPDAHVMFGRNRFGPKYGMPEYDLLPSNAGEQKTKITYSKGAYPGGPPLGFEPEGAPADFAGLAAYPANYEAGIPLPPAPACDRAAIANVAATWTADLGWAATAVAYFPYRSAPWQIAAGWTATAASALPPNPCPVCGADTPAILYLYSLNWVGHAGFDMTLANGIHVLRQSANPLDPCYYEESPPFPITPSGTFTAFFAARFVLGAIQAGLTLSALGTISFGNTIASCCPANMAPYVGGSPAYIDHPPYVVITCVPPSPAQASTSLGWVASGLENAKGPWRMQVGWQADTGRGGRWAAAAGWQAELSPRATWATEVGWLAIPLSRSRWTAGVGWQAVASRSSLWSMAVGWLADAQPSAAWAAELGWISDGSSYTPGDSCSDFIGVTPAAIDVTSAGWTNGTCTDCANLDTTDTVPQIPGTPCGWTGSSAASTCAGASTYIWGILATGAGWIAALSEVGTGLVATWTFPSAGCTLPATLSLVSSTMTSCIPPATITLDAAP